jgi:hypothetical protein
LSLFGRKPGSQVLIYQAVLAFISLSDGSDFTGFGARMSFATALPWRPAS